MASNSVAPLPSLSIRRAAAADQEAVKRLVAAVLEEFGLDASPCKQQDADLDDLAGWYPAPRGLFEVIEDEQGMLHGCGGVHPIDQWSCELRKLYFLPSLRGLGMGSAMLDRFVRFARQAGYQRMELETASALHAAIELYKRRGFSEMSSKKNIARCDRAFEIDLDDYRPPSRLLDLEKLDAET